MHLGPDKVISDSKIGMVIEFCTTIGILSGTYVLTLSYSESTYPITPV